MVFGAYLHLNDTDCKIPALFWYLDRGFLFSRTKTFLNIYFFAVGL